MQELQTTPPTPVNTKASGAFSTIESFNRAFKEVFDKFECVDATRTEMFNAAYDFCKAMAFDAPPYWLSLLGTSGSGKTMVAKLIVRFFNRHLANLPDAARNAASPVFARYLREGGVLEWYRCMNLMVKDHDYDWMPQARTDYLVAIDDIGVEYQSHRALSASKLYDIFSGREKRWSVFTANLSVTDIRENIDTRIASRLLRHGAVVIDVKVPDFNLPNHGL